MFIKVRAALRLGSGSILAVCDSELLLGMEWLHRLIMKALKNCVIGFCANISLILFVDVLWHEQDGWDVEAEHDGLYETACWLKHLLFLACFLSLPLFFQRQVVLPWKCISRKKLSSYFLLCWTIYFSSVCLKLLFKLSVSCDSIAVNFL